MIGYMSLEEQVDADFTRTRRKALLGRIVGRLRRGDASNGLHCFDEIRKLSETAGGVHRGRRTVPLGQIVGNVGRCSQFDKAFMSATPSMGTRWKRIDRAFHRGEGLPAVCFYKAGGFYFVLDGHHRLSVASYQGVEWVDAEVTGFGAGLWRGEGMKTS